MKKLKQCMSIIMTCTLMASAAAPAASAKDEKTMIRIIVENNTLSSENGADWTGTLIDEWVEADNDATASSLLISVLEKNNYSQTGADIGYITEINGLTGEDGGSMGGWMLLLDDWVTDEGINAYTVGSGKLENGDVICLSYSCSWGADLGYDWSDNSTLLSSVSFSEGAVSPDFTSDKYDYVITLPENTGAVSVVPKAANKAYRAKIYKSEYTPAQNGTSFPSGSEITVTDGDVIIIGVGNEAWMQANYNNAVESVYRFSVNVEAPQIDTSVQETESLISAIGDVDSKSAAVIEKARKSYDRLSEDQKARVTNYSVLTEAEKKLEEAIRHQTALPTVGELRDAYINIVPDKLAFGNEWEVINLSRFGLMSDTLRQQYILSVKQQLDLNKSEKLSATRSTVNSGVITALTSIGVDPSDFYGYNLLNPLADIDYVSLQGVNGDIYALIALDSHSYQVPSAGSDMKQTTKDKLIESIITAQEKDGGWTIDTWSGADDGSDADMTAMAIEALAPYYGKNKNVTEAIDKALAFLSNNQNDKGLFRSYGGNDSESCAQVLTALCALSIDYSKDDRFVKNGINVYDALVSFISDKSMSFSHFAGGEANALSTQQAYTSLVALYRFENQQTSIFDMSDVSLTVLFDKTDGEADKKDIVGEKDNDSNSNDHELSPSINVPETGSSSQLLIWLTVLVLSGMIIPSLFKRKENN